jgi:hypothetical protein
MPSIDALEWRTSSFTENGANCVEVALTTEALVRDSKAPSAGTLMFPHTAWHGLLASITE